MSLQALRNFVQRPFLRIVRWPSKFGASVNFCSLEPIHLLNFVPDRTLLIHTTVAVEAFKTRFLAHSKRRYVVTVSFGGAEWEDGLGKRKFLLFFLSTPL